MSNMVWLTKNAKTQIKTRRGKMAYAKKTKRTFLPICVTAFLLITITGCKNEANTPTQSGLSTQSRSEAVNINDDPKPTTVPDAASSAGAYVFTEIPKEGKGVEQHYYFNSVMPEGATCVTGVDINGGAEDAAKLGWLFTVNGHELHCRSSFSGYKVIAKITVDRQIVYKQLVVDKAPGESFSECMIFWDDTASGMRIGGQCVDLNLGQYILGMLDNLANNRDAAYNIPDLEKSNNS